MCENVVTFVNVVNFEDFVKHRKLVNLVKEKEERMFGGVSEDQVEIFGFE